MNKIYTMLILVVGAILVIAFLPVITDNIDNTLLLETVDTIPPVFGEPTPYVVDTEFPPISIISIDNAHGWIPESQYNLEDGVLTLLSTDAPVHTYDLDILYTYEDPGLRSMKHMLYLIPFLLVILLAITFMKPKNQ